MRSAERIVLALGSSCETRKPPATAQGSDTAAPPSEDLVRISLMSDIPNEPVVRRVKYIMQRDRKFHDAEPPRCPPVTETASMVSVRSSFASWTRSASFRRRKSAGVEIVSSRGVLEGLISGAL